MPEIHVFLDGRKVTTNNKTSILSLCREQGLRIPTLCDDPQLKPHGSCGMCVVEVQGYGLVTSCTTAISDGMTIETRSDRVLEARRKRLEDFLAEHYGDCDAPCELACPAGIDIQGYLALIRRGAYAEAADLIRERLPLPAVIGRVCPRFCESACRRNLVDSPVAICSLKRFVADYESGSDKRSVVGTLPKSGHKVGIVGAGPAGLSAAYYLALKGHDVTIFEALPSPGGMLRYGIPDYRLPQDVLDREINSITDLGVCIETDRRLGRDFTVQELRDRGYGALLLAMGCHESTSLGIPGEELPGVHAGIDFLRQIASGHKVGLGRRVAVVGGGNTAMDAARTALRVGAEEVTVIYRRSRTEMPASSWEIAEAEEEGVRFRFLAAPVTVSENGGRVSGLECAQMALGEPDASGRRRPVPISGSEFVLETDAIIAAIGQQPEAGLMRKLDGISTAPNGTIKVSPESMWTGIEGVFAGGDLVSGAATAVEAIAAGRRVAMAIDGFLRGDGLLQPEVTFRAEKGSLAELAGSPEFAGIAQSPRAKMPSLSAAQRVGSFVEFELGLSEEQARTEASRCLECGCKADYSCQLRKLATEYAITPPKPRPGMPFYDKDTSHPFIERDANKCIACARCGRICSTVQGVGALGFNFRISTHEGNGGALANTACESCGQCLNSCPVGALTAKGELRPDREVRTVCPYCGTGCGLILGVCGDNLVSLRGDPDSPVNRGNLCVKGRFGYTFVNSPERLKSPLIKRNGEFVEGYLGGSA